MAPRRPSSSTYMSRCTWWTSATRGFRSHSGVKNAMPLMTSSTTSASAARPRRTAQAARGNTVSRVPIRWIVSSGPELLDLRRTGVIARDDRDPMAPGDPARDLPVEVGPGAAALGMRPVAVGEDEDVALTPEHGR